MSEPITIQDIDEATAAWLSREAERRGMSVETLVLQLIRAGIETGLQNSQLQAHHDLDSLAGTWDDEEATRFLNATADFEQVDEKLWR